MSIRTVEHLIGAAQLFSGLAPQHLETIAGCASTARFDKDEYLFREGEPADTFYVIRSGSVALEAHLPGRGAARILTLRDDDVLGWSWLFPPYRWQFDAQALEPVRAVAFDGACLRTSCTNDHTLGYELMRRFAQVMVSRLQATRLQLLDMYES
jgi:CRP/FNR family cyclic AMP-dependent transcriptional regulator